MVNDALRADRLGCYGYHRPTSPNIDRFAGESVLFERALSNSPWSASSFMSLFSSLSPEVHGVSNLSSRFRLHPRVSGRIPLLAEILQDHGYLTVGLHGGGNIPSVRGFDRGFNYYGKNFGTANYREVADLIRKWLEESRSAGRPIFLFLHHLICHDPYLYGPGEFRFRFLENPVPDLPLTIQELDKLGPDRAANFWKGVDLANPRHKAHIDALYDGGVYFSDFVFEELMEVLREEGIYDEALIILTADHGEALGERGTRGHGALWIEHLHVPLLLKFPGAERGGRKVAVPVGLMDVVPTLFEYLQVKHPDPVQGTSLLPLAAGRGEEGASPVVSYRAAGNNPYFNLGELRITEGDYAYLRGNNRVGSLLSRYLVQKRSENYAELTSSSPGESVEDLIRRGDYHFDRDLFGDARLFYQRAMEAAPDNLTASLRLAAALREEHRYDEAEELVRDLIARNPGLPGAYRELACISCDQRIFGEAGERFARAAELFPGDPRVYLDWGNCLRRQGRREEAEDKLLEALRLAGDEAQLHKEVAALFRWMGQPERAVEIARVRAEEYPGNPEFASLIGDLYLAEGKIREAEEYFQAAVREDPSQVWPYLAWADFLSMLREDERVIELLERVLEISPGRVWLLRAAGEKYLELEDPARAADLLVAAAELEPEDGFTRLLLATALRRAGRMEEAERELREAESRLGEDPGVNLEWGKIFLARGRLEEAEEVFARAGTEWMGSHALYDLKNDPGETRNRFLELPRVAGRMLELERTIRADDLALRRYFEDGQSVRPTPPPLDKEREAEIKKELKLLGY